MKVAVLECAYEYVYTEIRRVKPGRESEEEAAWSREDR